MKIEGNFKDRVFNLSFRYVEFWMVYKILLFYNHMIEGRRRRG